jgi:predicted O-methyltransferase YrrM
LELGTRHGLSAIAFCNNIRKNDKIISVDWFKQKNFADKAILKKFPNLSFINGNCLDLSIFKEIPMNIDLLLLDTEHTFN